MHRLNKTFLKNLKLSNDSGKVLEYHFGEGLILRINPGKNKISRIFYYRYTINGKKRLLKLAVLPAVLTTDAIENIVSTVKKNHLYAVNLLKNGIDPKEQLERERTKQQEKNDIQWLANDFYSNYILPNRKVPRAARQLIEADIIPLLGDYKLDKIQTVDITRKLDSIVKRGSPMQANKVLALLKQMFNYGVSKGLCQYNPLVGTKAKDIGGTHPPRDNPLDYEQIKQLWHCLEQTIDPRAKASRLGIKLLLLTGVRTGSLIKARWDEFDFENRLWIIPPEHLKLKKTAIQKPHKVPLTDLVLSILDELKQLTHGSVFVFPNREDPTRHADRHLFKRTKKNLGIDGFNIHDLRATLATRLSELDIEPHIVELILGHSLGGIFRTYNKHEYLDQRRKALELWSNKIYELVYNANVVSIETHKTA